MVLRLHFEPYATDPAAFFSSRSLIPKPHKKTRRKRAQRHKYIKKVEDAQDVCYTAPMSYNCYPFHNGGFLANVTGNDQRKHCLVCLVVVIYISVDVIYLFIFSSQALQPNRCCRFIFVNVMTRRISTDMKLCSFSTPRFRLFLFPQTSFYFVAFIMARIVKQWKQEKKTGYQEPIRQPTMTGREGKNNKRDRHCYRRENAAASRHLQSQRSHLVRFVGESFSSIGCRPNGASQTQGAKAARQSFIHLLLVMRNIFISLSLYIFADRKKRKSFFFAHLLFRLLIIFSSSFSNTRAKEDDGPNVLVTASVHESLKRHFNSV